MVERLKLLMRLKRESFGRRPSARHHLDQLELQNRGVEANAAEDALARGCRAQAQASGGVKSSSARKPGTRHP